jgi:hypothetical protein
MWEGAARKREHVSRFPNQKKSTRVKVLHEWIFTSAMGCWRVTNRRAVERKVGAASRRDMIRRESGEEAEEKQKSKTISWILVLWRRTLHPRIPPYFSNAASGKQAGSMLTSMCRLGTGIDQSCQHDKSLWKRADSYGWFQLGFINWMRLWLGYISNWEIAMTGIGFVEEWLI